MQLFETVLARVPGAEERGPGRSKWQTRWVQGAWLGRAEESDAHLVYVDGRVGEHLTIRRVVEADPRRWDHDVLLSLAVTPWRLQDVEKRTRSAAESTGRMLPGGGLMSSAATMARAERIIPLRLRPSTPGCAACSKRSAEPWIPTLNGVQTETPRLA